MSTTVSDRGVLILVGLAPGSKHGYALAQDIEEFAGIRLGPGTLYGALAKLQADGLIAPLASHDRRNPYRITPAGEQALTDNLTEKVRISRLGLRRLAQRDRKATQAQS